MPTTRERVPKQLLHRGSEQSTSIPREKTKDSLLWIQTRTNQKERGYCCCSSKIQVSNNSRQRGTPQTNLRRPNHHHTKSNGPQLPNHNGRDCGRDLRLRFTFYIYIHTHKRKSTRMVQRFQSVPHHATTSAGRRLVVFVRSNGWWLRSLWVAFVVVVVVVWYQSVPFRNRMVANAFVIPLVPAAFHSTTRRIQHSFRTIPNNNNNKASISHHLQSRARDGTTTTRTALRRPNHDDDDDDTLEESAQSSMPLLLPASSGLASSSSSSLDHGSAVSTTMATKPTNSSSSSLFSSSSFLDFLFPPNYTSSTVSSSRNHNDNSDTHHTLISPSHVTLRKLQLQFTCNICGCRNHHAISRSAYQTGVVIVTCQNTTCAVQHLIADHLGFTNLVGSSSNRQNEGAEEEDGDSRKHPSQENKNNHDNNNKDDPPPHSVARAGGGNIEDFLMAKEDNHHDSAKTNLAGHDTTTTTHSPVQRVSRQVFELEQAFYNSTTDQDPSSCRNETPNQYE